MELKKEIEKLGLINDINSLSPAELANKYLCNRETYEKFLREYGDLFEYKTLYQLRVNQQYKKILDIIAHGNVIYPGKENEEKEKKILGIINHNIDKYELATKLDDEIQALFLFDESIGKNKTKDNRSYKDVVDGMHKAAIIYEQRDHNRIDAMPEYIFYNQSFRKRNEFEKVLDTFCKHHTLSKECNNIDFLYLANYLLIKTPDNIDESFIDDVINVIRSSFALEEVGMNKNNNFNDYKKAAKFTLKKIKKFENNKEKELKK